LLGIPEDGVAILTAGVDVQDDRLELEIVGWGKDEESWSIDYRTIFGDPSGLTVWNDLDGLLSRRWGHLFVEAACVDTGGHHTLSAYAFCRGKDRRRIWAIKGKAGSLPLWPRRPSRNNKGRVNLFTVGVDTAKEAIYSRLRGVKEPGPGYSHFPLDRDVSYFEQLTAEKKRVRYSKGFPVHYWWKPDGETKRVVRRFVPPKNRGQG
jgi:phage terminase large subunit GpA-like protein